MSNLYPAKKTSLEELHGVHSIDLSQEREVIMAMKKVTVGS